jgi:hypothetical protein
MGRLSGSLAFRHALAGKEIAITLSASKCCRVFKALASARNLFSGVWGAGQWTSTFQSQNGSVFAFGYWSAIFVGEGDAWKIRVWTVNQTPPPTPRAETK